MNKFKKLIVVMMSVVMALALAVPAFAADEAKTKLKSALLSYGVDAAGVVDSLTGAQMDKIKGDATSLKNLTAATVAAVKANPYNAGEIVGKAIGQYGIPNLTVKSVYPTFVGNDVIIQASVVVNGVTVPASVKVNMGYNVGPTTTAVAANPIAASSASVIKATGDNSAVVVVAAVLAVVAVLGLGFRKNSSFTVA